MKENMNEMSIKEKLELIRTEAENNKKHVQEWQESK